MLVLGRFQPLFQLLWQSAISNTPRFTVPGASNRCFGQNPPDKRFSRIQTRNPPRVALTGEMGVVIQNPRFVSYITTIMTSVFLIYCSQMIL
jgi:hypothetical protein